MRLLDRSKSSKSAKDVTQKLNTIETTATQKQSTVEEWLMKGVMSSMSGNYKEAMAWYDKVIEIEPKLAQVWSLKGAALFDQGRYQEALECFDVTLAMDPQDIATQDLRLHTLEKIEELL